MAWSLMSFVGLPINPPAASWLIASTFTIMASLVFPFVLSDTLIVGVGSAHISTRIFVSLVECMFAVLSISWCPSCIVDTNSLCNESIVAMVYIFFSVVASFDPVAVYFEHIPAWTNGMRLNQFLTRG